MLEPESSCTIATTLDIAPKELPAVIAICPKRLHQPATTSSHLSSKHVSQALLTGHCLGDTSDADASSQNEHSAGACKAYTRCLQGVVCIPVTQDNTPLCWPPSMDDQKKGPPLEGNPETTSAMARPVRSVKTDTTSQPHIAAREKSQTRVGQFQCLCSYSDGAESTL